ncbi:MAG: hypothetical protein PVI40_06160 [Chlamydiota bacterium]|jgi:hypothetical protein
MAEQTPPPTGPGGPIEPTGEKPKLTPDKSQFDSYMQQAPGQTPGAAPQGTSGVSPMELAQGGLQGANQPTLDSLLAQVNTTHSNFENVKKMLQTPNLKFKRSQEHLLRNKLSEANTHLMAASNKMGAQVATPMNIPSGASPVERFIGLVTNGENQLHEAQQALLDLKDNEGQLNPGDMMLVQVKLAQAQQNLEYASILLSKTIDVLKQMINIQL